MNQIRPISDLRNNFAEISKIVHSLNEPVFLTKNGYGDMVVMSVEQFAALDNERRISTALIQAQAQVDSDVEMLDFKAVSKKLRAKLIRNTSENV